MKPQRYWNGQACSQEERDTTAKRVFQTLKDSKKKTDDAYILCGDMLVVGYRRTDDKGQVTIDITDCIVRRRTTYLENGDYAWSE